MKKLIITLVFIVLFLGTVACAADFVLIMNKSNPYTSVSQKDIKKFYLGKKTRWEDGAPVTVFAAPNSPVHADFMRQMVQKSAQQYTTYWKKMLFTGTGLPPKTLDSPAQVKQAVAAQEGALGYIPAADLDNSVTMLQVN